MNRNSDIENSYFIVQVGLNRKKVQCDEVLYFYSENHRTLLVTKSNQWAYPDSLTEIEKSLPSLNFVRVHRNAIVNLKHIKKISNRKPMTVVMVNEFRLSVSRNRKKELMQRYEVFLRKDLSPAKQIFSQVQVEFGNSQIYTLPRNEIKAEIDRNSSLDLNLKMKLLMLAQQPHAKWLGQWNKENFSELSELIKSSSRTNRIPTFVIYKLGVREENYGTAIDEGFAEEYLNWMRGLSNIIGTSKVVLILEPNALCGLEFYDELDHANAVLSLIKCSVEILKQCANVKLYIDAGHPYWLEPELISVYLARAGVDQADGFALNVSNYVSNEDNFSYGERISRLLGGKHFIIDTSRNGTKLNNLREWCNRSDASIGEFPTFDVNHPLVDAFFWVKPPYESDGSNGGEEPAEGAFWLEKALNLIENSLPSKTI